MKLTKKARRATVAALGVGVAAVAWVALPAEAATTGTADVTSSVIVRNDMEDGGAGNDYLGQNTDPVGSDADALYGGPGLDAV